MHWRYRTVHCQDGMEVTINEVSTLVSRADLVPLWSVVLVFEIILRLLERWTTNHVTGKAQFPLLSFAR
jgi:hypothetical protein